MQVKVIESVGGIEEKVNAWLKENQNIEIHNMRYKTIRLESSFSHMSSIIILYKSSKTNI